MTKLFSALLAGALTIALAPAASAQAWAQVPDQIVVRDAGGPLTSFHVTVLEGRWWEEDMPLLSAVQLRPGLPPLLWGPRSGFYDLAYGWHPFFRADAIPAAVRQHAPWRGYLPEQPPEGTSDRVYEDLLLALSIRRDAWGAETAALGVIDDEGVQAPVLANSIPEGWVVTGQCLGTGTVWYGDMGISQCVDGFAMRSLIEPPRRPHHP